MKDYEDIGINISNRLETATITIHCTAVNNKILSDYCTNVIVKKIKEVSKNDGLLYFIKSTRQGCIIELPGVYINTDLSLIIINEFSKFGNSDTTAKSPCKCNNDNEFRIELLSGLNKGFLEVHEHINTLNKTLKSQSVIDILDEHVEDCMLMNILKTTIEEYYLNKGTPEKDELTFINEAGIPTTINCSNLTPEDLIQAIDTAYRTNSDISKPDNSEYNRITDIINKYF